MTKVINIDALSSEPILTIVLNGKEHHARPTTIEDFVQNIKLLETLGPETPFAKELEICVDIIARAFPTLTKDDIMKWQVTAIQAVFEAVRGNGGQNATAQDEEGNLAAS